MLATKSQGPHTRTTFHAARRLRACPFFGASRRASPLPKGGARLRRSPPRLPLAPLTTALALHRKIRTPPGSAPGSARKRWADSPKIKSLAVVTPGMSSPAKKEVRVAALLRGPQVLGRRQCVRPATHSLRALPSGDAQRHLRRNQADHADTDAQRQYVCGPILVAQQQLRLSLPHLFLPYPSKPPQPPHPSVPQPSQRSLAAVRAAHPQRRPGLPVT